MVPQVGLEPTRISPLASKTSVATITPPGQKLYQNTLSTFLNGGVQSFQLETMFKQSVFI